MGPPPTDPDPRPPAATPAPVPSSDGRAAESPAPAGSSTQAHQPIVPLSDLLRSGSSARTRAPESDIAQFLAHPKGGAANTDDSPTIITRNGAPPSPAPMPLVAGEVPSVAGRRLGHFELIGAIGAGGMAAVLKARDLELGRVVALKILPPEAARDPESVTRFKQEARAAAKLDHENVARVYFCGEDQGLNFIAFEFVEGDNLRAVIDRRGPLPAAECVRYMIQVAAGLNHAAERGVVHRDVKPSNILITPDGRAKIVDMGLARYLGSELVSGSVTQSGVTLGTFDYISPEQALDPRRADVRSDIYSLGCTFYHALTGRPPVPEGTAARKLRAHQEDPFLDPRELNPAIPDELAAVLARMVQKDPAARYQTPLELIAHLKGLADRLGVADAVAHDPAAQAVSGEFRVRAEPPRVRAWWLLAAVAVAAAAVALVVMTADSGPLPVPPSGDAPKGTASAKSDPPPKPVPHPPAGPPAGALPPVRTAEELAARLADPATTRVVLDPKGAFDLTELPGGAAFAGKRLELASAGPGLAKVVLTARSVRGGPGSLVLKAGEAVEVRGVWFELQPDPDPEAATADPPAGLRIDDAAEVRLTGCVFQSGRGLRDDHAGRAVVVSPAAGGDAPRLTATRCLFGRGGVGLVAPAGAHVFARDSGFAPGAAAVQFDAPGEAAAGASEATFDRCSFMLDPGAAAAEAAGDLHVTAAECVFAPVYGPAPARPDAAARGAVVRVRGDAFKDVALTLTLPAARPSAFYRVDPARAAGQSVTFDECKGVVGLTVEDAGHVALRQRPWAKSNLDPLALLASADPWRAFRLDVESDPALFTVARKGERREPLGSSFYLKADAAWEHRAYPDVLSWPPAAPRSAAEAREKVWNPDAAAGELAPGEFADLKALLRVARPDDVVLIKRNGDLPVNNEELKAAGRPGEGDLRVTFRPAPGFRPVLVVHGDMDRDQTLFKLKTGEVAFEDLQFRLAPNRPKDGQMVAAVAVIAGKGCTFRRCVFTLAEEDDSKAAAVHLPDADKVMKMDAAARPVPKVVFDHCVVRGRGRGVWVEVSRPLHLEVTDTLTALDGPVLLAQAGGGAGDAGAATSTAKLTRVTAFAGGTVVEMRGGRSADVMRPSGLVRLDVEADDCLFAAVPEAGRPLLDLEGVDPADWKAAVTWRVPGKANRYANFPADATVALIRAGGDGMVKEWGWADWVGNVGEPPSAAGAGPRVGKVKFAGAPTGLKELAAVKPSDAAVESADFPDPADSKAPGGADWRALPRPGGEPKPE